MNAAFQRIRHGDAPILIISDHASNHVPEDIDLGIAPELLTQHVALDIGAAEVSALLAERLGCTAILGGISRLVCDLNREEGVLNIIPHITDHARLPFPHHHPWPQHGRRARLWRATGMKDGDFGKPIIAIANSFTQFVPGHVHLKDMGQLVAREIEKAGGVAKEFNTIAVDDGIAMGHDGMLYSLPSRAS
jgi:hypothetical protein